MDTCQETEEDASSKLHELDALLWHSRQETLRRCEEIEGTKVKPSLDKTYDMTDACRRAQSELNKMPALVHFPATLHAVTAVASELVELRGILLSICTELKELKRAAADSYYDHHKGVMPHLSKKEIEHINNTAFLVPRASTED